MQIDATLIDTLVACELSASMPALCADPEWRKQSRFKILDVERIEQLRAEAKRLALGKANG